MCLNGKYLKLLKIDIHVAEEFSKLIDTVLYHDVSNHRIDINSGNLYREMNIQNSV